MNPANQAAIALIVSEHGITQNGIEAAYEQGILVGAMRAAQAIAAGTMTSGNATTTTADGGDDGSTDSPLSAADIASLKRLGIDPNKKFRQRNTIFTITGYRPSRWKFPISCTTQNGARYKFAVASVVNLQK